MSAGARRGMRGAVSLSVELLDQQDALEAQESLQENESSLAKEKVLLEKDMLVVCCSCFSFWLLVWIVRRWACETTISSA